MFCERICKWFKWSWASNEIFLMAKQMVKERQDITGSNCVKGVSGKIIVDENMPSVVWCCWLGGMKGIWPVKNEWWDAGMVICLGQGADLHMVQLISLPLTVFCSRKSKLVLVLLFWYQLTRVVPDKIQTAIKRDGLGFGFGLVTGNSATWGSAYEFIFIFYSNQVKSWEID